MSSIAELTPAPARGVSLPKTPSALNVTCDCASGIGRKTPSDEADREVGRAFDRAAENAELVP